MLIFSTPVLTAEVDDLSLEDLLNSTITTASKFSQRISEAPSTAVVIRGDEIRSHGWRNLSEALGSVPGLEVSTATDYRYLGVRGFSQPGDYNSRILLLVDGIPSNDGVYDQAMIGTDFPVDMNLIERVEVVPGASSALYGGNAYLAVVNVITRSSDSLGRSVTLGAGNEGYAYGQASGGGKDEAGRHWMISASLEGSNGMDRFFPQWQNVAGSDGWARGMDGERLRKLFLRVGGEDWSAHLMHGQRKKDAAGAMYASDFSEPAKNSDVTTQIGLRHRRLLSNGWSLESQAYAGSFDWEGRYSYSGVWDVDKARSSWLGASEQLSGKPWNNQTWVLGASFRDDFKREQENAAGLVESKRRTVGFYAQDEVRINEMFTLNLGGRYDRDTLDSRQFSPRGALIVNLPRAAVLKLLTSKAFRPPNAYETEYSYPGTQLAGGSLKPERVTNSEISLEQAIGANGRWNASVYRNRYSDLIGTTTDFDTGIQQIRNVGDARTKGLNLGARYRFAGGFDVRGSLSWQSSEDAAGAPLPNSPRRLAKLLAVVPLGTNELGWETYYSGPRRDAFGAEVGRQAVSHAALSGRISRDLRWQVRVRNVFDRHLATVVGHEYSVGLAGKVPTITDYGRQFQIHLTLDF